MNRGAFNIANYIESKPRREPMMKVFFTVLCTILEMNKTKGFS